MSLWIPLISGLFVAVLCIGCILLGYWMGRNSSERPMRSIYNNPKADQGLTEDPGGDPFEEAMEDRTSNERIAIIK